MSIKVESTTDTPEDVIAAQGGLSSEKVETKVETKKESDSTKEVEEKKEASDASDDDSENESEENDSDDDESKEDKPKKKSRGFKRRIDKLNARISEYEKELSKYRQPQAQPQREEVKEAQSTDGAPDPDDFDTISAYTTAIAKWTLGQENKAIKAQEQEAKAKEEYDVQVKEHNKRLSKYTKDNPAVREAIDYAIEVLGPEFNVNPTLENEMLSSDISHLILAELLSDVDELERINSLPTNKIAREIGKLEAKLSLSKEENTETKEFKKPTKAPAPLKTVGNKSTGGSTKSPDEMDFHEYKKWRAANS